MVILSGLPFCLIVVNLFFYREPDKLNAKITLPKVSVLIPARNEAAVITDAITSVLKSKFIDIELIVLNDHSTDDTVAIVTELAQLDSRLKLIHAPALPNGWCGKQHACFQLAKVAKNDILLFIDADITVTPDAIARICQYSVKKKIALVSGVPRQITKSWSEKLIIPLIHFILLGFLPIFLMRFSKRASLAAGCGQFIAVRRDAYWAINGHASIASSWHDGIHLPKQLRYAGFKTDLCDLTCLSTCRMYKNVREVWMGFIKNATEGMAGKWSIFFWSIVLVVGQVLPILKCGAVMFHGAHLSIILLITTLIFGYGARFILAIRFRQSFFSFLLHPVGILFLLTIQWSAWYQARSGGQIYWKDRIKGSSS